MLGLDAVKKVSCFKIIKSRLVTKIMVLSFSFCGIFHKDYMWDIWMLSKATRVSHSSQVLKHFSSKFPNSISILFEKYFHQILNLSKESLHFLKRWVFVRPNLKKLDLFKLVLKKNLMIQLK